MIAARLDTPRQIRGILNNLPAHASERPRARALARTALRELGAKADAIVTNAAGCGSAMKEYGVLFAGEDDEAAAREVSRRVRDVSEFLADLGMETPPALSSPLRVAYQDACHLLHAQPVASAPRALLRSIANVELVDIQETEICCGSAGT